MNMVTRKYGIALATVVVLSCVSAVHAGAVTATLGTLNSGAVDPYTSNLSTSFRNSDGSWTNYSNTIAGEMNWTNVVVTQAFAPTDPGAGVFATGQNFSTFCIEGTQNVGVPGTANWTAVNVGSAPQPNNVAAGLIGGMGSTKAAWLTEYWNKNIGSVVDDNSAAGFQLGVWAIVYNATSLGFFNASDLNKFTSGNGNNFVVQGSDGTLSYHNNTISGNDGAVVDAAKFLANVNGNLGTQNYALVALSDSYYQDQIVGYPVVNSGATAVPLPAALPAGAAMLVSLGALRWLRAKRRDSIV